MPDGLGVDLQHPMLGALYSYWDGLRDGRAFPARRDFCPAAVKPLLGSIALIDVFDSPLRFRFRLIGTRLVRRWGFDLTGRWVDEFPEPECREMLLDGYRSVVESRRPRAVRGQVALKDRLRAFELVWLPLSADGARIDMLLAGSMTVDWPRVPVGREAGRA